MAFNGSLFNASSTWTPLATNCWINQSNHAPLLLLKGILERFCLNKCIFLSSSFSLQYVIIVFLIQCRLESFRPSSMSMRESRLESLRLGSTSMRECKTESLRPSSMLNAGQKSLGPSSMSMRECKPNSLRLGSMSNAG